MFDRNPGPYWGRIHTAQGWMLSDTVNSELCIFLAMCSLKVAIKKHHHRKPLKLAVIKASHFSRDIHQ